MAGGYSGGAGEELHGLTVNGKGGIGSRFKGGGGYFESGSYDNVRLTLPNSSYIGGQGGNTIGNSPHCKDSAGDGGIAGKGGIVNVSSICKVYAYNGNKYTDGTDYEEGKNQLEIYAQGGILREIYKYNAFWNIKENYNYNFFSNLLSNNFTVGKTEFKTPTKEEELANVLIRRKSTCAKSGYINSITKSEYGIGSGAGYIELYNGSYKINSSMNN